MPVHNLRQTAVAREATRHEFPIKARHYLLLSSSESHTFVTTLGSIQWTVNATAARIGATRGPSLRLECPC